MTKEKVVQFLEELATLLELKGESPFKTKAYITAARVLSEFEGNLADAIESRALLKQKGIGKGTFERIAEWVTIGRSAYHEEIKASTPPGLLEMLEIRGLGIKKIRSIHETLGITNLVDLEYACIENRLTDLPGFGKKTQEKIQKGIAFHKKHSGYLHSHTARMIGEGLLKQLRQIKGVHRASVAGELRRRNEIASVIDLIASSEYPADVKQAFCALDEIDSTPIKSQSMLPQSEFETIICTTNNGISVHLHIVPENRFSFLLHHFTGNAAYHAALATRVKQFGLKISQYGLFLDDHALPCQSEHDLFTTLELDDIPAELREGRGEIEASANHSLPQLVTEKDIRGIFHVHTDYSDGSASLFQMVEAADRAGLEYIGISDHSQSAFYANGLKPDRVRKQHEEIDKLQKQFQTIKILKGIESDILPNGSLDYDEGILSSFDFVIASVHSNFNMTEEAMTDRVIRAISHPAVTMLGHPTGRLLLSREGYPLNIPKVISAARQNNVAIELNASPYRLDLDWRYLKLAKDSGVRLSLNPDAHQIEAMTDFASGIGIARKGWLSSNDLINTRSTEDILQYINGCTA